MNNHYAKFEYEGMKTAGVTNYTNQTPSKHFWKEKMSKFNTPQNEKISMKCAQNSRCTSSAGILFLLRFHIFLINRCDCNSKIEQPNAFKKVPLINMLLAQS